MGPIDAIADLQVAREGTHLRVRWGYLGTTPLDPHAVERIRTERRVAVGRLGHIFDRLSVS